jgi:hypothetical protein
MADQAPKDLIGFLDYYLVTKAPFQLPPNAKEAIVKYGPWIAVVLLILLLPPVLLVLGLGALLTPFSVFAGPAYAAQFGYLTILTIVQLALVIAALPGLFARKMQGWRLMFYSRLVSIVTLLLSGLVMNAIVSGLIGLYILFQIRSLYEEKPAEVQEKISTT